MQFILLVIVIVLNLANKEISFSICCCCSQSLWVAWVQQWFHQHRFFTITKFSCVLCFSAFVLSSLLLFSLCIVLFCQWELFLTGSSHYLSDTSFIASLLSRETNNNNKRMNRTEWKHWEVILVIVVVLIMFLETFFSGRSAAMPWKQSNSMV